jgi:cell division inhibitor SepF
MSALINKMLNLVGFDNEEELMEEEGYNSNASVNEQENTRGTYNPFKKNSKVVNLTDPNQLKLVVMQPNSFDDAQDVCDHLKEKKPVVINLEYADKVTATKLIDFLSGAVYALKGSIKRLQGDLFLMTPEGINIMTQSKH